MEGYVARLGVLALSFGDGSVCVVSVPHPQALKARFEKSRKNKKNSSDQMKEEEEKRANASFESPLFLRLSDLPMAQCEFGAVEQGGEDSACLCLAYEPHILILGAHCAHAIYHFFSSFIHCADTNTDMHIV